MIGLLYFVAVAAAVLGSPPAVAQQGASTAGQPSLRLVITPQRDTYVDCEPVLVEWRLSNTGGSAVVLPAHVEFLVCQRLDVIDSDGRFVTIRPSIFYDGTNRPPTVTLQPGQSMTGWFDLGNHARISAGSVYRVRAVLDTRAFKGVDGMWCASVTSGTGEFAVVEAKDEDAKAVALVEAAIVHQQVGQYRGSVFSNRHQDPDLPMLLIEKTKSDRFHAAADFFLGLRGYPESRSEIRYNHPDFLKKPISHFDRCAQNPAASDRLRALAMYYAMRCRAEEVMWTPRDQTVSAAYRIIDEFPGTCGADRAEKFLASLGTPVTSTPSQRFWLRQRNRIAGAVAAIFCLCVGYAAYGWRVRARRTARGACRRCGYDLRGRNATGVCPECGEPTAAPAPFAPPPG